MRIGTAEIYNVVEEIVEVADSLAIGQQWKDDQRIILFVQIAEGFTFDDNIVSKIKTQLRSKASPRHVPTIIMNTPDIPYTFSGKKVESAITNIIHGRTINNRGAIRNPESLEFFEKLGEQLS